MEFKDEIEIIVDDSLDRCLEITCDQCPLGAIYQFDEPMIECYYHLKDLAKAELIRQRRNKQ